MLPNLVYDRSKRKYLVLPDKGEVVEFPCGRDGKRAAFQLAIAALNQSLYDLARQMAAQYPQAESRVWMAAEIVLDSDVLPGLGDAVARVNGSSEYGPYTINQVDGILLCDCPDHDNTAPYIGESGQKGCKHVLAVLLNQIMPEVAHAD